MGLVCKRRLYARFVEGELFYKRHFVDGVFDRMWRSWETFFASEMLTHQGTVLLKDLRKT